jgi:hypothetical protein
MSIKLRKSKGLKPCLFSTKTALSGKRKRADRRKPNVDEKGEISSGVLITTASGMYDVR